MQAQHGAHIVLAVFILTDHFLIVCLAQKCQCHTVTAQRRLDDIGDIVLVCFVIEIGQILAGSLLMATQIVVGTVSAMPHSSPHSVKGKVYSISVVARE